MAFFLAEAWGPLPHVLIGREGLREVRSVR